MNIDTQKTYSNNISAAPQSNSTDNLRSMAMELSQHKESQPPVVLYDIQENKPPKSARSDQSAMEESGCAKIAPVFLAVMQIVMILLIAWRGSYRQPTDTNGCENCSSPTEDINMPPLLYPMFQDVHVMIFVGFGFLMTFLKRYGYGAVGFNLLLASFVVQWAMICRGVAQSVVLGQSLIIELTVESLISADFVAGAVLISFGAVLGKANHLQLSVMAFVETILYAVNEAVGASILGASDIGGSIFIHTFGAYFGLAVARVMHREAQYNNPKEGSVYHSDLFSMIGTVFLWMYWPSFNSVTASGLAQERAILNTVLSICSSSVISFAISSLVNNGKINMVHIQNATLAGGVAVGAIANMNIKGFGAMVVGTLAGVISVAGYQFLTPFLATKLSLHDTCGVNNLHGMPGLLSSLASVVCAAIASYSADPGSFCSIFPKRCSDSLSFDSMPRSAATQAGMQAAALAITLAIGLSGGILSGILMRLPFMSPAPNNGLFDDATYWDVPDDFSDYHGDTVSEYQTSSVPTRKPTAVNLSISPEDKPVATKF